MEVSKLKAEGRITMEVTNETFQGVMEILMSEKKAEIEGGNWKLTEEITKKAFFLYIQTWISRDRANEKIYEKPPVERNESEDRKDRKQYILKLRSIIQDLKRCGLGPLINGFAMGEHGAKIKQYTRPMAIMGARYGSKDSKRSQKREKYGG